jgi:tRNA(Ile)-lysidine synthase
MNQQDFLQHWHANFSAFHGKPLLLAVSGGSDSMVMAHLFLQAGLPFAVAHCNFCLRGKEADLDEALVQQWCEAQNIRFHAIRFNTAAEAATRKTSIQETARNLRYEWLLGLLETEAYAALATAHHANDNAETLLMHLFKGTGISGMHGIPIINGKIIRPLLFALKEDIQAYATVHQVPFRNDASNFKDTYLRNAIRLKLMPVVEELFPQAIHKISSSIANFRQAEMVYDLYVNEHLAKLCEQRGKDIYIPIKKLLKYKTAATLLYECCKNYGFTPAQSAQIFDLCAAESGKYVSSSTHQILHNRNFLIISALQHDAADMLVINSFPATVQTGGQSIHFSIVPKPAQLATAAHIAYIDLAQIELPLLLRRKRNGDYFYPLGMGMKKKKLSNYLIDQKIPLHEKERLWVLESNKRIVWLLGHRLDERFKVKDHSTQVLQVQLT